MSPLPPITTIFIFLFICFLLLFCVDSGAWPPMRARHLAGRPSIPSNADIPRSGRGVSSNRPQVRQISAACGSIFSTAPPTTLSSDIVMSLAVPSGFKRSVSGKATSVAPLHLLGWTPCLPPRFHLFHLQSLYLSGFAAEIAIQVDGDLTGFEVARFTEKETLNRSRIPLQKRRGGSKALPGKAIDVVGTGMFTGSWERWPRRVRMQARTNA
jgi:hypothetical protein